MITRHPLRLIADALALLTRERTELATKALLGGMTGAEEAYLCTLEYLISLGERCRGR